MRKRSEATRPLEAVQIDHAKVDAIIVDEETGRQLGRPWIALGIDVATRVVTGFHLTLAPPTLLSASLCFLHSVCDKTRWLAERGLSFEWPVAGLPETLHVDADSFFGRRAFARACRNVGVETVWRAPNGRRYGVHIEELIGDRLGDLRLLTNAEPIRLREDEIRAPLVLSLDALERRVGAAIAGGHLRHRHAELRRAPLTVWRALAEGAQFRAPADCVSFRLAFLPEEDCAVDGDGISLLGRLFRSRALADDLDAGRRRLPVKYDPRDLSRIFVRRPSGRFVKALAAEYHDDAVSRHARASLALADCCGWNEDRAAEALAEPLLDEDDDLRDAPNAYGASATACAQKCRSSCPFQSVAR